MKNLVLLVAWLAIAATGLVLGVAPEAGYSHGWLALALVAGFAASESRLWKPAGR